MPALAHCDSERLLRFVGEAESFGHDHPFEGEFLTQFGGLVRADWISYSDCSGCAWDGPGPHFERPGDERLLGAYDQPAAVKQVREAEDPVYRHLIKGNFSAEKLSDFLGRRELHRMQLYEVLLKPTGLDDSLSLRLRIPPPSRPKIFVFARNGRDFTARDRAVLDVLNPHLVRLHRAHELRRRLAAALALHESTGAAVVLLEPDGGVGFASTAARQLLERYFGKNGAGLPEPVASWLPRRRQQQAEPLRVEGGDRTLVVNFVDDALLFEEQRPMPRLTAREREILELVAEGCTNPEIAERLWISTGTVRKHLDNLYAKLGVHTRTAAAALVQRRQLLSRDP